MQMLETSCSESRHTQRALAIHLHNNVSRLYAGCIRRSVAVYFGDHHAPILTQPEAVHRGTMAHRHIL
jgi:hypothetical protein